MMIFCEFTSGKVLEKLDALYIANKVCGEEIIQGVAVFTDPQQAIQYSDNYSCEEYRIEIMKQIIGLGADPYYNCK